MTVLSRGARARRGGRRPGWVLLTALLVLAIGASSALVFTNRVELLKLAVILALWAAIAGAFVSVLYRRQSDADQSRVRDLKLVYDLQLDREISARREYELTVESQLRRELASELRAQAADDVAALRAELTSLRTSLEILFDTDLEHRRALENPQPVGTETTGTYSEWARNGESPPVDWVASDRVTRVGHGNQDNQNNTAGRPDESSIIDVPEEPLVPPRPAAQERARQHYEHAEAPPPPEPRFDLRQPPQPPSPPPLQPQQPQQPPPQGWQPVAAEGQWLPPGTPGSNWAGFEPAATPPGTSSGRRRRARHSSPEELVGDVPAPAADAQPYGESGRRARSRHATEYGDFAGQTVPPPPAPPPPPAAAAPPPRLAPAPAPEPAPRHRGADPLAGADDHDAPSTGGQSVAELFARLQVEPSGGGRRRRRDG